MTASPAPTLLREHHGIPLPVPGTYQVDPAHTTVEFVARHLMITKVRGRFTDFSGEIDVAERPEDSSVDVTVRTASLDTSDERRDAHLRGPDFFDVERYPTMTFRSTGVEPRADGTWEVTGDLTVRGVTRPLTLDVEFEGATTTPWGDQRIGVSASAELDREAWGLTWNQALETGGFLVGRTVRVEINAQASRR